MPTESPLPAAHYRPIMDEADAQRRLAREPFPVRLWRRAGTGFRRMECVWLPYYRMTVTLESRSGEGTLEAVIDGYNGSLMIVSTDRAAVEGMPPDAQHFPARLTPDEAMTVARHEITAKALSQRGSARRPHVKAIATTAMLYWPYWIYYFERRAGRLDIRLLDGLTGERPGHKLKSSVLTAFLDAAAG